LEISEDTENIVTIKGVKKTWLQIMTYR
jgi:hypothetical protein